MSTLEQRLAARSHHHSGDSTLALLLEVFAALRQLVAEWRRRAGSREALMQLSDRDLRDIGLTRAEAERESLKPFWRA